MKAWLMSLNGAIALSLIQSAREDTGAGGVQTAAPLQTHTQ